MTAQDVRSTIQDVFLFRYQLPMILTDKRTNLIDYLNVGWKLFKNTLDLTYPAQSGSFKWSNCKEATHFV